MATSRTAHAEAIRALCENVLPVWSRHLNTVHIQTETGVGSLMQSFAQLKKLLPADGSLSAGGEVNQLVDQILLHLQFQDRTSQMLSLLMSDMDKLAQAAHTDSKTESLDVDAWLEQLASGYAMQEQHTNHPQSDPGPSAAGGETTYF